MTRKGNCWDNSVSESFFNSLKQELVYIRYVYTRKQAKREIFEYIEADINGLKFYIHKTRELLILACTEVENQWQHYW